MKKMNRETWLMKGIEAVRPMFEELGATIPEKVRVTCGWPSRSAGASKKRRIGECWSSTVSGDGTGHGPKFRKLALALGLTGKMTATEAGPELEAKLKKIYKKLGEYPHAKLDFSNVKKAGTRMIKAACPTCGYTVRLSRKWIEVATPRCPDVTCIDFDAEMEVS